MPINGMSLSKGATSVTIVGGTATSYVSDGITVSGGIHVVDSTVQDLTLIPHLTFKSKPHRLLPDGKYSKAKREGNFTLPTTLASGDKVYNVARWTFELHPELTAAQILEMRIMTCQAIMDAELDSFYKLGATN
jgi:hypothetical protein